MGSPARGSGPQREFFKIGEVAKALNTTPSAIRFYQARFFPHIRPSKSRTDRNVYSRRDVQVLKLILMFRREQGLSVRDARERLHDLLVKHQGDPFAIEAELRTLSGQQDTALAKAPGSDAATPAGQGELPLDAPGGLGLDDGLREPAPPLTGPDLVSRVRALEREVEELRRALEARQREADEARRVAEERASRLREAERERQRALLQLWGLRVRIRQAVEEMLLDGSEEGPGKDG